ncbi:MAG: thioredoxin-disulfide reductase [Candidatus Omnitrophica bacterium]|nr:thioredoxin-disulfide reductase [Candidatus Omnitrophota bacterium]
MVGDNYYDIVIIGGGPAGLTAALYACRARMKTLLVEKSLCGGQILVTDTIENYPGFPDGIKGPDLAEWMLKQAERFGLEVRMSEARAISPAPARGGAFGVELAECAGVSARAVILAMGARWNTLNIPGEKELGGRGVSYCATCDGPLFRGKEVIVVGGGDTALEDALFLTKFAAKVTIIHRRDKLRATKILQERAFANKKIEVKWNSVAVDIIGRDKVESIGIKDVKTEKHSEVKADGVFVLIGTTPNSAMVSGVIAMDEKGYILTDPDMRTSIDGIFACGDVRKKLLRQVITASGDGATAAFSAEHYVESMCGAEYK